MTSNLPHSRRAIRRIVTLAACMIALVVAGAFGIHVYIGAVGDRLMAQEEKSLLERRLERARTDLASEVRSAAIWDDAYLRMGPAFDFDWADSEIGGYYTGYFNHDLTLALDPQDRPVYAYLPEGRAAAAAYQPFVDAARPLVEQVRREDAAKTANGKPRRHGLDAAVSSSGIVRHQGQFYAVAVAAIIPLNPETQWRAARPYLALSARRLDADFLKSLDTDLLIREAAFAPHATQTGQRRLPVVDVEGRVVGDLVWSAKDVGKELAQATLPWIAGSVVLLLILTAAIGAYVRRVTRTLVAGDAALDRTMAELVRARDQADAANVAKSAFLANMSHEIRTPLNGVLGMAQVMAREELCPRQRERLNVIRASGETLLGVLNDILDISKIEAGRMELDVHDFDLAEALAATCTPFASLADQKDVGFRVEIQPEAEGLWRGDGVRLRQVLANLTSNALKFTSQGEIVVSIHRTLLGLGFTVQDTGIGIPAERQGELFQKFSQVDASTTRRFGGTGLGLAISRELVQLMGWRLVLASAEGQGSRFSFDLPMEWRGPAVHREADTLVADVSEAPPLRILAAEDNPTNQLILQSLLEPLGVELRIAANGREAVQAFDEGGWDLILMDVQMPEMNGVEATDAIRREEARRGLPAIPILALSANVMRHQVQEYLDAGMNGFVPKPIEAQKLFEAIAQAVEPAAPEQGLAA